MRPETGSMEFEDDWPGVWIRGDQAMYWGLLLENMKTGDGWGDTQIASLSKLLLSCNAENPAQTRVKPFAMCARGPCHACKHSEYIIPSSVRFIWSYTCDNPDSPRYKQLVRGENGCGECEKA